jgi:hypothetical protein
MGKLFGGDVKFYVYPMPREAVARALAAVPGAESKVRLADASSPLIGGDDLLLAPPVNHLYRYLRESGDVVPIEAE